MDDIFSSGWEFWDSIIPGYAHAGYNAGDRSLVSSTGTTAAGVGHSEQYRQINYFTQSQRRDANS